MGGGSGGGASTWKLKKAAKNMFVQTCGSFCRPRQQTHVLDNSAATPAVSRNSLNCYSPAPANQKSNISCKKISSEASGQGNSSTSPSSNKNLCAICLDPLNYKSGGISGEAIFTAQCSHAFHFACISSNVRHGNLTCPICRAHWTRLPRNLNTRCPLHDKTDPILRILDDSIANLRTHRQSSLRSTTYNDDDQIMPCHITSNEGQARLSFSLLTEDESQLGPCLRVKLGHWPPTDLVLVASPNGPHLRLMKQAMASAVFSLRPDDRLAIVAYSSAAGAARVFPLRRMTSYGKRAALQAIDRVFYMGLADPMEGLRKGVKILGDRVYKNPRSHILHLTDSGQSRSYDLFDVEAPIPIHRFYVGTGFWDPNGFAMDEFEEFLARTLGGGVRDIQLRIGEGRMIVRIGELRGGEERNIPLCLDEWGSLRVKYSYRVGGDDECISMGEVVVEMEDKGERSEGGYGASIGRRMSSAENWEYHDPFMGRRWAKHLHRYRL